MSNLNYGILLSDGHIEMFEKLEKAVVYAKENKLDFIDVYSKDSLEIVDFIKVNKRSLAVA